MPSRPSLFLVGGLVVSYVGLMLFSGGIVNIRRNLAFDREGVLVDAAIVRTETRSAPSNPADYKSGGTTMLIIHYRYRTPDGAQHDGIANPPREMVKNLGVGDSIKVRYLPSQPDESQLRSQYGFTVLLSVAGVILLGAGLGMIVKGVKDLRAARQRRE